jgi:hypothetical protein
MDMTIKPAALVSCAVFLGVLTGCASAPPRPRPVCVDFDPPQFLAGTQYPSPGQAPGATVFTTNGIRGSIHPFLLATGASLFEAARIEQPPVFFGSGQAIRTNNITLEFDFGSLPFTPSEVMVAYLDLGGSENLAVNGTPSPIFVGQLPAAPNPIGGAAITVTAAPVTGGTTGTLILRGPVKTLRIGGQEFWIDQVCARS